MQFCAKLLQSCPTLCDPIDRSPLDVSDYGILKQEYRHGMTFPPPGGLRDPGITPTSLGFPTLAGSFLGFFVFLFFTTGAT